MYFIEIFKRQELWCKMIKIAIKYLSAGFLVLFSMLVFGYSYGSNPNHIQILPFIYKVMDPSLYLNDYYVATLNKFPTLYPYLVAFLAKWFNLESMHLLTYILIKYVLLITGYNLSFFIINSSMRIY